MKVASLKKHSIKMCVAFLSVWLPAAGYSETGASHVCESHYEIFVDGIEAGEAWQRRSLDPSIDPPALRVDEGAQILIDDNWSYSITSTFECTQNGIKTFDHKISENDIKFHVRGEIQGDSLWSSAYRVMTQQEKKKEKEDDFLLETVYNVVPHLENGLQLLSIFSDDEDKEGEVLFPLNDYDATNQDFPLLFKRNNYSFAGKDIRLLDTENLEVRHYIIEQIGEEKLEAASKTFQCRTVCLKAPKIDVCYWIAEDEIGAFLVKEQGEEEGIAYEIMLKAQQR
jgi:hypothetical protein